ncbi:MAG: phosphohistidine phosphatase SixA [Armatimonadota bacterium]
MQLYLMRHGEAEAASISGDEARELTEKGRRDVQTMAEMLIRAGARPECIYTSPLTRARQTAEIVARLLGLVAQPDSRLRPGAKLGSVQRLVEELTSASMLLVGHEPDMSSIVFHLTDGRIRMRTGGVARVDADRLEPGSGVLVWLASPELFPVA